jgi:hypothetical protein
MVLIIMFVAKDYLRGAEPVGDTIVHREVIEPHDDMMEKVDKHYLREVGIGKGAYNTAASFLNNVNTGWEGVSNMFQGGSGIQSCLVNMVLDLLKFIVHENCLNCEAGASVDLDNAMKEGSKFGRGAVWYMFNRC